MIVKFEMTRDDFIAFNLYHQSHSPALVRQRRYILTTLMGLSGVGVLFALLDGMCRRPAISFPLLPLAFFPILGAVVYLLRWRAGVRKTVLRMLGEGRNQALLGAREVTLSPVEITEAGELKSTTVRWKAVERIETSENHGYIYIGAVQAFVIPRRAFTTEAEFETFLEEARGYWRAALRPPS